jgi:hypothetical protein
MKGSSLGGCSFGVTSSTGRRATRSNMGRRRSRARRRGDAAAAAAALLLSSLSSRVVMAEAV